MKALAALAAVLALLSFDATADANRATEAEAQAMVKKAIQHYDKVGKDKAMADFSQSPGPFVDRDLYVVVDEMDGTVLAHINPKILGRNMIDLRDADGHYQIRERVDAAKKGTSGWQDFKFFNPVTKKIEPKRAYWEKHDNLIFACGAYKAQ
jgi:signal transduction histidine kinase